ncbi:MAG TPA: LysM peptidoglycan-binding domain-containing protein [Verrucomicrobiae bacterium]
MKKISLWFLMLILTAPLAPAQQSSATQQQLDELRGQIQNLNELLDAQRKHIDALEKEIGDLRDKVNTPVANDSASNADLKKLADQVQEIANKRAEDRETILNQIEKLSKLVAAAPVAVAPPSHKSAPKATSEEPTAPATPMVGHEYKIQQGDTLGLILKAYRDKGVKVSKSQVIKANPGINPDVLIPGKVLFIPDPAAK